MNNQTVNKIWNHSYLLIYLLLFLLFWQHESIQAIAFNRDVNYVHDKLQLYETYYIANAAVVPITDPRNQTGSVPLQLTLTKAAFIKKVGKTDSVQLADSFPITAFWSLDKYKNSDADRFSIKTHE